MGCILLSKGEEDEEKTAVCESVAGLLWVEWTVTVTQSCIFVIFICVLFILNTCLWFVNRWMYSFWDVKSFSINTMQPWQNFLAMFCKWPGVGSVWGAWWGRGRAWAWGCDEHKALPVGDSYNTTCIKVDVSVLSSIEPICFHITFVVWLNYQISLSEKILCKWKHSVI